MSAWDEWFKRLRERKGFFFPEIDNMIDEMEKEMAESFRDMENLIPRDMVRVRRLPDGSIRRPRSEGTPSGRNRRGESD
jgi:hypothetical protein